MGWLPRRIRRPHWGRTAVYEFYDRAGDLLYVGISSDPKRRFSQHADDKAWFGEVDPGRVRVRWYATRKKALKMEKRRIKANGTRYNHVHNPRRGSPRPRWGDEAWRPSWSERAYAVAVLGGTTVLGEAAGWWDAPTPVVLLGLVVAVGGARLGRKLR